MNICFMLEIQVRSGRTPYLVYMAVQYICLFAGWSKSSFFYFCFLLDHLIHQIVIFAFILLQKLDEAAVQKVFLKSLDNYTKWCTYLGIQPVWSEYGFLKSFCYSLWLFLEWILVNCFLWLLKKYGLFFCSLEAVSKEKRLLFVSLYFLIWGEAANIRFLPECLCYIFHHVSQSRGV